MVEPLRVVAHGVARVRLAHCTGLDERNARAQRQHDVDVLLDQQQSHGAGIAQARECLDDLVDHRRLHALERLYIGKGQFEELLGIYTKKLDLTSDGDERIAIQSKIGQLYEDEVKDDKKATAQKSEKGSEPSDAPKKKKKKKKKKASDE